MTSEGSEVDKDNTDTTQLTTTSKENGDLSTANLKTDDGSATHVKTPAEVAPQNEVASREEGDEALDEMGTMLHQTETATMGRGDAETDLASLNRKLHVEDDQDKMPAPTSGCCVIL